MPVDSESAGQLESNYNTWKQTDTETTVAIVVKYKLGNKFASIPISYLYYQVRVIYDCWVFSKFKIGDHVLQEPFCKKENKRVIILWLTDSETNVNINV